MATLHRLQPEAKVKRRVLVVEDDLDSVHWLATLIKMMGHEVQFAINGFAAIDVARTYRPNIVILDIELPNDKGEHIARQLRYEPGLEGVRIIAISGAQDAELEQKARQAGCVEFHRKPIDPRTLEQLLERQLETRKVG